jgi:hypothetical protein
MCTTGVLRLGPDDYLLFKNKDFGRSHFDDRLVLDRDVFGVEGITTWAGDDPDVDEFSGFSIGANRNGLLCCDSNVRTLPDHDNYDRLVEIALREGTDVPSAVEAVRRAVADRPFLWANLVMIDSTQTAAVEVRSSQIEVVLGTDRLGRSNHHVVLGATPSDDDVITTALRLESVLRRVKTATTLEDILELQTSHDDGSTGICNHLGYSTVYTYVIRRNEDRTSLYVRQGQPCQVGEPLLLELPLGERFAPEAVRNLREAYPSARALADLSGGFQH